MGGVGSAFPAAAGRAWGEAQAEEGAGRVAHAGGAGGVSRTGGCSGTGQVRRFNGKLWECCGHRGEGQCSRGGGAVRELCFGAWGVFAGQGVL